MTAGPIAEVLLAELAQEVELHPLQQRGAALAEGFARGEREAAARTLGQPGQAALDRRGQLAVAERQRGRLVVEGVDDARAVRAGETPCALKTRSDPRGTCAGSSTKIAPFARSASTTWRLCTISWRT